MRRSVLAALGLAAAVSLAPASAALADAMPGAPSPAPTASPADTATPAPTASGTTTLAAPGPVRRLAWAPVGRGARLTWAAPDGARGGLRYTVVLRLRPGTTRSTETTGTGVLVPDVAAGARVDATVTAADDAGSGPPVPAPTWTAPSPPGGPAAVSATAVPGAAGIRVTWSPPPVTDAVVTGFVVEVRAVAALDVVVGRRAVPADRRTVTLTGLRHGVRYVATVAAVGAAGAGPSRGTATVVTSAAAAAAGTDRGCDACAGPAANSAAPARSAAAAPRSTAVPTLADAPPVRSASVAGPPLRLVLGIGGIVVAALLAIAAVLLRRRSVRVG